MSLLALAQCEPSGSSPDDPSASQSDLAAWRPTRWNPTWQQTTSADGWTPTSLAVGQNGTSAIAVDATSMFWSNGGDGTAVKLAK